MYYTEIESSHQTKVELVNKKEWIANCQRITLDTYSDTNDISPPAGTVAHNTAQEVTYLGEVWQVAIYSQWQDIIVRVCICIFHIAKSSLDHWLFKLYIYWKSRLHKLFNFCHQFHVARNLQPTLQQIIWALTIVHNFTGKGPTVPFLTWKETHSWNFAWKVSDYFGIFPDGNCPSSLSQPNTSTVLGIQMSLYMWKPCMLYTAVHI